MIKNLFLTFCKVITGSTFFVSGIVKANDIRGFSYKLEEYFEDGALAYRIKNMFGWESFTLEFLIDYALIFAIALCLSELILGLFLVFNIFTLKATKLLTILALIFFVLTLHTATCDPQEEYTNIITLQKTDPLYIDKMDVFTSNASVELVKDQTEYTRLKEKKSVQCVTDCGCFGDAMKGSIGRSLTPWESFSKDVVLLLFLLPILFMQKNTTYNKKKFIISCSFSLVLISLLSYVFSWYFPVFLFVFLSIISFFINLLKIRLAYKKMIQVSCLTLSFSAILFYTLNYLPLKDFRPYSINSNILEKMSLPENAKKPIFEQTFYYKNTITGETKEFNENNYPWDDSTYKFVDRISKLIEAGDTPEVTDFSILSDEGGDLAESFLREPKDVFIFVSYKITKAHDFNVEKLNIFVDSVNSKGYYFIGLTSSLKSEINYFKSQNHFNFDFYGADEITLKTIIRANPGILWLKNGIVMGKWPINHLPDFDELNL